MALMHLTIIPLGTGSPGVGKFVADIQKVLQQEAVDFKLNDMGTTIHGEVPDLLALAAKLHEMPFQKNVQRVVTQISIDDRRDKKVALGDKIRSVEAQLE